MYQEKWKNYYFPQNVVNIPEKWTLLRRIGKDKLTEHAQEKLEWIIFYHTIGKRKVTATATYFGITRKTLHKYLKRFDAKDVTTLEEASRSPHKTREWMVTAEERQISEHSGKTTWSLGKRNSRFCTRKSMEKHYLHGRLSE